MRLAAMLGAAIVLGAGAGCAKNEAASAAGSDLLVRSHFEGLARVGAGAEATKLKAVLALPETQALREQVLSRLARAPQGISGGALSPEQAEACVGLLRPLLDDVLDQESVLEVRGPVARPEWLLAVSLNPDRRSAWQAQLSALMKAWNAGAAQAVTNAGFRGAEWRPAGTPRVVRWVDAGGWGLLGVGHGSLPALESVAQRLKAQGRPLPARTNEIWQADLALDALREPLGLPAQPYWPRVSLSVGGRGENLRTVMNLSFAQPVTGPLTPWQVPTNLIGEPLISFTAMRGIAPWLERSSTLAQLEIKPAPNELYFWAQQALVFQSFLAFPSPDPTNTVARMGRRGSGLLNDGWRERGFGNIEWQPAAGSSMWRDLPYITPFVRPSVDAGRSYVFGGLFPPTPGPGSVPRELLSQISGRSDLVYYDWEITQHRLAQWRTTSQLFAMLADRSQFTSNMVAFRWLTGVEPLLGNTITEITASSPKEWSVTRKSHIGFTGVELVALARWLESTHFPRLGLEMPRDAASAAPRASRPAAAPR